MLSSQWSAPLGSDSLRLGHLENRSYSSEATKLSANDSASFPFRFMDVHARAALDPHREQFFEVPLILSNAPGLTAQRNKIFVTTYRAPCGPRPTCGWGPTADPRRY